jgi:hypothetical protein
MGPDYYNSVSESGSDSDSDSQEDSTSEQDEESAEDSLPEEEPLDDVEKLKYWSRRHYMHYRPLLLPDHVRVSYLLCPHPKVIEHAKNPANRDTEDRRACERLIKKLMVPVEVVDRAQREIIEAQLIDTFLSELSDFQNRQGPYASSHPWIIAQNEDVIAHEWHEKYSLVETKVLGALACRVTSKAKGVGCAERHWKAMKRHKKGKRGKLGSKVTKKLSTISAAYSYELSALRRATAQRAGKLWEDDDFENYSNFCSKNLTSSTRVTRSFRAWEERWEKVQFDSSGDEKFAARLSAKYEGLKWIDVDSKREMHTAMGDCVVLKKLGKETERKREKGRGWGYFILGLYENYDESKNHHENERTHGDVSSYDFFEMCNDVSDFYYMVKEFYKANPVSGFRVCEKEECDSLGSVSDVEDDFSDGEEECT